MFAIGSIRMSRGGLAFFIPEAGGEDLLVAADGLRGAIHADRVRVSILRGRGSDFRAQVAVDEILERTHPLFTGDLRRIGRSWIVQPDSPLLPERLPIRLGADVSATGVKILFRVETPPGRDPSPFARFEAVLGERADPALDPIVIATEFGLALRFSDAAMEEADRMVGAASSDDDRNREDFRDQLVLTIDPEDAKDFDDAISIVRLPDGGWDLTVHIADVTHYVTENGPLDQEAIARGTSVYFPGSVVPMLPEVISNLAASLSPDEDKRVLSVVMRFLPDGQRSTARVARGWMRSRSRLHYAQAQAILDESAPADPEIGNALREMHALARVLRRRRFTEGAFELDLPEAEMRLGADGVPVELWRHRTHESNRLIEEFMIAANLAVGALGEREGLPILFRIHAEPDPRAIDEFVQVALTLLPATRVGELDSMPKLRRWLASLPAGTRGQVLQRFFLRSLKKAVYAADDIGHFGLGVKAYAHFTSPIRRYPDLWTHRRVKDWMDGLARRELAPHAVELGLRCSRAETNAQEAEREMNRLKTARYLSIRLGEEEEAFVSGVTSRGLFVEWLRMPVEGFVPRASLSRTSHFLADRMAWVDDRGSSELRPGDRVRVTVARVDRRTRQIEFALVARPTGRARAGGGKSEPKLPAKRSGGRNRSGGEKARGHERARAESLASPGSRPQRAGSKTKKQKGPTPVGGRSVRKRGTRRKPGR